MSTVFIYSVDVSERRCYNMKMDTTFGETVYILRKRLTYTSQQLADALKVSQATVTNIENDYSTVQPKTYFALCDLLGIDPRTKQPKEPEI